MSSRVLLLIPRALGILVCLFVGAFSLDAFANGKSIVESIPDFAIHIVPALILFAVVGLAWRWPLIGGLVFTGLAVVYAYVARAHSSWVAAIAGPMLFVGILFLWSWQDGRRVG
jgi:hypothetical protein